jgi:hypothetical protein
LSRIRQKILDRDYYLFSQAEEEMAEKGLERTDVENAILNGAIDKKLTRDVRGTRYRLAGPATDCRSVRVVCRFKDVGGLIIITVYTVRGRT